MSLWDIDKVKGNRVNPILNAPDKVASRMAHRTTQVQNSQDNDTGSARMAVEESRLVVYDTANPRIIMGVLPDGTYGIVISKEGTEVTSVFS